MKYLLIVIVTLIAIFLFSFLPFNTITVRADETKTLDSEITRLAKQYAVNEKKVRRIIKCESQMYGEALNHNLNKSGKIWSSDWGPLQINDFYHEDIMSQMGLDIHDKYDSLEYGFILISKEGYKPWSASKGCWNKTV